MFEYFSSSGVEKFTFYRLPKALFTNNIFRELSCESKVLYGLLLDRASVSKKNRWIDEKNRVYVFMTQTEAMEMLSIGKGKAVAIFRELEDIGLIVRKKLGQGNPTRIYVMNFSAVISEPKEASSINNISVKITDNFETSSKNSKTEVLTSENRKSELISDVETCIQNAETEVLTSKKRNSALPKTESQTSYYRSKTNMSNNNLSIYQDTKPDRKSEPLSSEAYLENEDGTIEGITQTEEEIKEQIDYAYLLEQEISINTLDLIVDIIACAYAKSEGEIVINSNSVPISLVKRQFKKLNHLHIEYILDCVDKQSKSKKIKNLRSYLQSTLYNAPYSIDLDYDNMVNYDTKKT